jgi:hypothetical protein
VLGKSLKVGRLLICYDKAGAQEMQPPSFVTFTTTDYILGFTSDTTLHGKANDFARV